MAAGSPRLRRGAEGPRRLLRRRPASGAGTRRRPRRALSRGPRGLSAEVLRAGRRPTSPTLARDETRDAWNRAAGAFWAARAADKLGEADLARSFLRAAAQAPADFYGMIADRRLRLEAAGPLSRRPIEA